MFVGLPGFVLGMDLAGGVVPAYEHLDPCSRV